jgi:SOS response regulatory protein OraA/RecX
MPKIRISTEELLKRVEENRLREELLREPYLVTFRATQEEIELREAENAQEAVLGRDEFGRFAERLAHSGREEVRFQRYLIRKGFYPRIPKDDPLGAG